MGILRLLYVILHFFITYIHNFHVALSELIDRLNPLIKNRTYRWPAAISVSSTKLGANKKDECLFLQSIGSELKRIQKLPTHVACLFTEKDVNIDRVIAVIEWCAVMGISCISLFDYEGSIASCQDLIKTKLNCAITNSSNGLKTKSFTIHKGFVTKEIFNSNSINIFLLSQHDGKPLFAQLARKMVTELNYSQINQDAIENSMNQLYPKDPELLLQIGSLISNTTLGYSPWHLRLTQMIRVPNHTRLRVDHLASAMIEYGLCQQRYGK